MNHEETFENELGNEILIQTEEAAIDGVPGVRLYIAGPSSNTEVRITRMEAVVLCEQLVELLTNVEIGKGEKE